MNEMAYSLHLGSDKIEKPSQKKQQKIILVEQLH